MTTTPATSHIKQAVRILRTRANEPGFTKDMCLQYAEQLELQELIGEPEFDAVAEYIAALIVKANDEYNLAHDPRTSAQKQADADYADLKTTQANAM